MLEIVPFLLVGFDDFEDFSVEKIVPNAIRCCDDQITKSEIYVILIGRRYGIVADHLLVLFEHLTEGLNFFDLACGAQRFDLVLFWQI